MKYEKPQNQNPHELPIKQHIFPLKSIERFANNDGFIETRIIKHNIVKLLKSDNPIFCGNRIWDNRAETGYMKSIENDFQEIATNICKDNKYKIEIENMRKISMFYSLWRMRFHFKHNPKSDGKLKGIHGEELCKNEEEIVEKKNMVLVRKNGLIPIRMMNGVRIQREIDILTYNLRNYNWGIVKAIKGEFIVPDNYGEYTIIPISPQIILNGNSRDIIIDNKEIAEINRIAIQKSVEYYFANKLANCPI
jgi:hypothetical protein